MQLDPEYLRQHYASLSDEALLSVDRDELVEMARTIFDIELGNRNLASPPDTRRDQPGVRTPPDPHDEETDDHHAAVKSKTHGSGERPEWLEDAVEVYSWAVQSSTSQAPGATLDCLIALEAAGITCYSDLCEMPQDGSGWPSQTYLWRLMAPVKLALLAKSVLECTIFNPEFEDGWKANLEALSDEERRAMNPEITFWPNRSDRARQQSL